jgi:lipid-binding SYLF domain-containing protein
MKKSLYRWSVVCASLGVFLLGVGFRTFSAADEDKRVSKAAVVLEEIMAISEKSIPPSLFQKIYAIAVVPGVIKAGFIVGGRYGRGVVAVRTESGEWSSPSFMDLAGGSLGFQIGAQATDVILVFKSKRSIDGIIGGKFTLGANASVAAGPVGRQAAAETDAALKAEIYSYSRSRGLFAGVSMEGAVLSIDHKSNENYYGKPGITAEEILAGRNAGEPASAGKFIQLLTNYSGSK